VEYKNKLIVFILCLLCIIIILYIGLKPFNFNSSNGVKWLKNENGIFFHDLGIIYGQTENKDSDQISLLTKNNSISIEIWLTPGSNGYDRFKSIFCLYDGQQREIFSLSQVRSLLNISKYHKPGKKGSTHNWRWLKNAFFMGQRRFLTITSDKNNTKIYLDGKRVKRYRNYPLMPSQDLAPTWRMIIGNNPSGKKHWKGEIYGLAIYNHALAPERVSEHFEKWRNKSGLSLLKERNIVALYPMDEKKGQIIHNAVRNNYHLSIPARFIILKRNFLKFSSNAFGLDGSSLRDMRINILGFIPLGWLFFGFFNSYNQRFRTQLWRPMLFAFLGGTAISLMVEILQAFLPSRTSSLTDLIFNTFGTGLGVIFALIFIKIKNTAHRRPQAES
jgi:hypothetical protein